MRTQFGIDTVKPMPSLLFVSLFQVLRKIWSWNLDMEIAVWFPTRARPITIHWAIWPIRAESALVKKGFRKTKSLIEPWLKLQCILCVNVSVKCIAVLWMHVNQLQITSETKFGIFKIVLIDKILFKENQVTWKLPLNSPKNVTMCTIYCKYSGAIALCETKI